MKLIASAICFLLVFAPASAQQAAPCAPSFKGALVLVGGGANRPAFMDRFMQLAGGAKAKIVIIPTAADDDFLTPDRLQALAHPHDMPGAVTVLHTRDRAVANSPAFVAPLRDATGVWILGGDETKLEDAYVGTLTETAIKDVLARGGVVGGTSAGAMIAGSILVNAKLVASATATTPNRLSVLRTHPMFDLLPNSYIVPHWSQRQLNFDLLAAAFAAYPTRTAIGIDQATAAIVQGHTLEVAGDGQVGIYDGKHHNGKPYALLAPGQRYDLTTCA